MYRILSMHLFWVGLPIIISNCTYMILSNRRRGDVILSGGETYMSEPGYWFPRLPANTLKTGGNSFRTRCRVEPYSRNQRQTAAVKDNPK